MEHSEIITDLGFRIISKNASKIHIKGCPVCHDGDSGKSRGYFLLNGDSATYFCHNCEGDGESAKSLYEICRLENRMDLAIASIESDSYNEYDPFEVEHLSDEDVTYLQKTDFKIGKRQIKLFSLSEKYIDYFTNHRKLHKSYLKNILKTDKGFAIIYRNKNSIYNVQEKNDGGYFFINNDKTSSFDLSNVYNLFDVSPSIPVIITEGAIDSLFINNSVSIGGVSKWKTIYKLFDFLKVNKLYFLQDNDKAGETVAKKILADDLYVFKWKQFLDDYEIEDDINDVNDLYKNGYVTNKLTFIQIRKYFTNSQSEAMFI